MATTNSAVSIADAPPPKRRKRGWNPLRVGNQPFFEDKNRAFWVLQSIGWSGYFFLRTLSNIANEKIGSYVIHNALLTAAGYSITLLMASAYRRLIKMRPLYPWVGTILIVAIAAAIFSAIETWSIATFVDPRAVDNVRSYLRDYRALTPEDIRRAIATYVTDQGDWSMLVLPARGAATAAAAAPRDGNGHNQ